MNFVTKLRFMVCIWFNMEAIPKSDIKSDIRFDISIKRTTWIGQGCKYKKPKTNV